MPEYHLIAHAGIHGAAVMFVTGYLWLGLIEWGLHTLIDNAKCEEKTSFATDQALHILCKIGYVAILALAAVI